MLSATRSAAATRIASSSMDIFRGDAVGRMAQHGRDGRCREAQITGDRSKGMPQCVRCHALQTGTLRQPLEPMREASEGPSGVAHGR